MKKTHLTTALLMFTLVVVGFYGLPTQTTRAQNGNLLTNPGFDGTYSSFIPQTEEQLASCPWGICGTANVPVGWYPFWIGQRPENVWWENKMPEYKPACPADIVPCPFMNRVKGGQQALQYFNFEGTNTAGVWQKVTVPNNARLTFSAWGQAWSTDTDEPISILPTSVDMRIGIDPLGGTNPFAGNIVWSPTQNPYDAYSFFEVQATAQGSSVTVFLLAKPAEMRRHNDFYWDEASLVVTGQGAPAPVNNSGGSTAVTAPGNNTASVAPPAPLPTANADGKMLITVQPGDTMWAIAARAGLTLDQFLALNPGLTSSSFIQEGQSYVVGQVEVAEPTAVSEPITSTTNTPETTAAVAALEEATAQPTATLAPSGGSICLRAFSDTNQDGAFGNNETLQKDVFFTIFAGEKAVSNYITNGLAEPYCIHGFATGDYRVSRALAANEMASNGAEQVVTLHDGDEIGLDFGSYIIQEETATSQDAAQTAVEAPSTKAESAALAVAEASDSGTGLPVMVISIAVALLVFAVTAVFFLRRQKSA